MEALSTTRPKTLQNPFSSGQWGSVIDDLPSSLLDCVGNTPLVTLNQISTRNDITVLGKLEMQNPGGSIKDRTAASLLKSGIRKGLINPGTKIVETSSGNLGIGLAQACCQLGLSLTIVLDTRTNQNVIKLVELYGATVEMVSETRDGETLLDARLRRVRELAESDPQVYWPNQYENPANPAAHSATMREIIQQTQGQFDRLYIATSTCGTLAGCRAHLKRLSINPQLVAVDGMGSAIFQSEDDTSMIESHLPGHGSSRHSNFLNADDVDEVAMVSDRDCVEGCHFLLQQEGILAGGTSGGIVSAFRKDEPSLPEGSTVVLLLCDRGERYLDTIYDEEWVRKTLPFS
ncbi:MAG: 2,3-diaminopropionate biosynthesis protein SbnA [Verrucomicrobiales bacterium]|nr:2,3-diaminopropionate biosynthesis protein SbnA [Verrucomicrobiales bacterium]